MPPDPIEEEQKMIMGSLGRDRDKEEQRLLVSTSTDFLKAALAAERIAVSCREFARLTYGIWDGSAEDSDVAEVLERLLAGVRETRADVTAVVKGFNSGCARAAGLLETVYQNIGEELETVVENDS